MHPLLVSAHFTLTELPATVAILLIGVCIGLWVAGRGLLDLLAGILIGLWLLGLTVSVLGDHDRTIARLAHGTVWDLGWLIVTLLLVHHTVMLLARQGERRWLRSDR